jgi:cytochrome P450/NADPH-cytochrome P450 reductase
MRDTVVAMQSSRIREVANAALKNPDVLRRARAEVDEVLGGTLTPTYEQIHRLTYVTQVLNEALRLWPTAAGFNRYPREDTVIGGRYRLPAGTRSPR